MRVFVQVVVLCSMVCTAGAQSLGSERRSPEARIADAEARHAAGRSEDAAIALRQVLQDAARVKDPARQRRIVSRARPLLDRVDPLAKLRRKATQAAAKSLVSVAQAYTRKKWFATALGTLQSAELVNATAVARPLAAAQKLARGASKPQIATWFGGRDATGDDGWVCKDGVVRSPRMDRRDSKQIYSGRTVRGDFDFSIETKLVSAPSKSGVVFGVRKLAEGRVYYLFEIIHETSGSVYRLFYWDPKVRKLEQLGRELALFTRAERADWMKLSVSVRGKRVRATVAGLDWIDAQVVYPTNGGLGLFVSGDTDLKEPIAYRQLEVRR